MGICVNSDYTIRRTAEPAHESGPGGRAFHAAPVTILRSDGPGLQGVESGVFTYGVHTKRKDAHEAAYKRSGFTHAAVGTAQGQGGEFDSPVWHRPADSLRKPQDTGEEPVYGTVAQWAERAGNGWTSRWFESSQCQYMSLPSA